MDAFINLMQKTQSIIALSGLIILLWIEYLHPFFDFFGGSAKEKGKHLLANFSLGITNAIITSVFFAVLWLWAASWANAHDFGILNWLALPAWAHLAGAILLMDAWMYCWHLINHKIPFLWRFHRVHHADPNMDVTTASRFHTGEIIISSVLRIGIIMLIGLQIWELLIYGTLLVVVVQFHHANIVLPEKVDRAMRLFIVTPAMHKVHHSRWQPETDSNYSSVFSFWDRLGRTFRTHNPLTNLRIGLDEFDRDEDHAIKGLFTMPFRKEDDSGVKKE